MACTWYLYGMQTSYEYYYVFERNEDTYSCRTNLYAEYLVRSSYEYDVVSYELVRRVPGEEQLRVRCTRYEAVDVLDSGEIS